MASLKRLRGIFTLKVSKHLNLCPRHRLSSLPVATSIIASFDDRLAQMFSFLAASFPGPQCLDCIFAVADSFAHNLPHLLPHI